MDFNKSIITKGWISPSLRRKNKSLKLMMRMPLLNTAWWLHGSFNWILMGEKEREQERLRPPETLCFSFSCQNLKNERERGLLALQAKCPIEEREREPAHQFWKRDLLALQASLLILTKGVSSHVGGNHLTPKWSQLHQNAKHLKLKRIQPNPWLYYL